MVPRIAVLFRVFIYRWGVDAPGPRALAVRNR
jgi:hypothetical protein